MSTWMILAVAVAGIAVFLLSRRSRPPITDSIAWPYRSKWPLTDPEQTLYFRLLEAFPDYVVLAQVNLSSFIEVQGVDAKQRTTWRNRIDRKSVDYLICAKDFSILAAIELDDATHDRAKRKQQDADKDRALTAAGVKIVRWKVKNLPNVDAIKAQFFDPNATQPVPITPTA